MSLTSDETLLKLQAEAERIRRGRDARQPTRSVPCAWPTVGEPRYLIEVRLRDTGQRFVCDGFDVTALTRGAPVNSTVMRALNVGSLISEATRRLLAWQAEMAESVVSEPPPEMVGGEVDEEFMRRRAAFWQSGADKARERLQGVSGEGSGRRYPQGHLEEVARIYLEARRRRSPTAAAVAEAFGISKSAAANQISRARAKGLLERTDR